MEHIYISINRSERLVEEKTCVKRIKFCASFMAELVGLTAFTLGVFAICLVVGG